MLFVITNYKQQNPMKSQNNPIKIYKIIFSTKKKVEPK